MSDATKRLFGFLTVFILISTFLGYRGIERLRRTEHPPFNTGLFTDISLIPHPSDRVILLLDSSTARVLVWTLVLALPTVCGIFAFRMERWILSYVILIMSSAVFGLFGFSIWLHALFDAVPL